VPTDDLSGIQQMIANAHAAVRARPDVLIHDPVISGDRALLDEVASRPDVHASFTDAPWRVEWVDLTSVLSIQKVIKVDGLDLRVAPAGAGPAALVDLCLPPTGPVEPVGIAGDGDGRGFTLSSFNPNLRFMGSQVGEAMLPDSSGAAARKMVALTFFVGLGAGYVHLAHYQGRYFLRDGCHRAVGLLQLGVTIVPAIVLDTPSFEFIVPSPGLFGYDVAFSDQPPFLADFWDDTVASNGLEVVARKAVRVRADEFAVQG
jgi:hypothetical protein